MGRSARRRPRQTSWPRWALIIEAVGFSPRAGNLTDVLHVFGNCLTSGVPGFDNDDFLDRIDNWAEIEDIDEPETYRGTSIVMRGHRLEFSAEPGAELIDVFRRLVPDRRELLLADEAELRRRIPADLAEIMRLDQWHQGPAGHEGCLDTLQAALTASRQERAGRQGGFEGRESALVTSCPRLTIRCAAGRRPGDRVHGRPGIG